jgi:hypothetical protein
MSKRETLRLPKRKCSDRHSRDLNFAVAKVLCPNNGCTPPLAIYVFDMVREYM